jgi:hypothetical protein
VQPPWFLVSVSRISLFWVCPRTIFTRNCKCGPSVIMHSILTFTRFEALSSPTRADSTFPLKSQATKIWNPSTLCKPPSTTLGLKSRSTKLRHSSTDAPILLPISVPKYTRCCFLPDILEYIKLGRKYPCCFPRFHTKQTFQGPSATSRPPPSPHSADLPMLGKQSYSSYTTRTTRLWKETG